MTTKPDGTAERAGDSQSRPTAEDRSSGGTDGDADREEAVAARAAEIALGILAQAQLEQRVPGRPPTSRQILMNLVVPFLIAVGCVGTAVILSYFRMSEVDIVLEVERAEAVQVGLDEPLAIRLAPGDEASFQLEGDATVDRIDRDTTTKSNKVDRVDFKTARDNVDIRIGAGATALFHVDAPHAFNLPNLDDEPWLPRAGNATLRIEVRSGDFDVTAGPVASFSNEEGGSGDQVDHLVWRSGGRLGTMTVESGKRRAGFLHANLLRVNEVAFSRSVADTGEPDAPSSVCTLEKGTLRFVNLIGDPILISARTCLRVAFTAAEISDLEIDETVSFVLRGRVTDISIIDPSLGEDATVDLVPSLMQFILSDRSLNSQWLVVVFLWGAIWSAIRLAVSGQPS